jgi:hypothetical protein
MTELPRIGLPTWREEAISRVVAIYDDPEMADGDPIVRVKRGAGDTERLNALLDLLSELYPEAAGLVRSSKASPKNRLTAVLGRLNEISLEGRQFVATSSTTYDWTDAEDDLEEKLQESVKQVKAKPKPNPRAKGPASDEAIRAVVKATEKPEDKPKPTRKPTTKTPVKQAPARKTTTRTRSK